MDTPVRAMTEGADPLTPDERASAGVAEPGRALLLAGPGGFLEVVGEDPQVQLAQSLGLHVTLEGGGDLAVHEGPLGQLDPGLGEAGDPPAHLDRPADHVAGDLAHQADPLRL